MSRSFAHTAIDVLTELAQTGEIDPWDVQVIDVVDRVLDELTYQDSKELSTSGQTFLYASMLVLLKAETLASLDPQPEEEEGFEDTGAFEGFDFEFDQPLPDNLEHRLHRRPVALPAQRRRVTLDELIEQLELMAIAVV